MPNYYAKLGIAKFRSIRRSQMEGKLQIEITYCVS